MSERTDADHPGEPPTDPKRHPNDDKGRAWRINSDPNDGPDRDEDRQSDDDEYHGNAWQINENTREPDEES